jgi:redox-sensitive bicupin YhaK (pirin superfamily)
MGSVREIAKVWESRATLEGAGVRLRRAFGYQQVPQLDPFLLLDDFHSANPDDYIRGFPWHPHRGIETITYMLEGRVEHGDSMGNAGVIGPGDVQWMTAGSGIIHQEMPKGDDRKMMWGFQLWANLPAARKMMDPRYREVRAADVARVSLPQGGEVGVVAGRVGDTLGPVRDIVTEPEYLDVTLPAGGRLEHPIGPGHTAFAYTIEGAGYFSAERDPYAFEAVGSSYFELGRDCRIGPQTLVLFGDGEQVEITADTALRFLLVSGKPIGEPVAWYGPIVMNTQEELRVALEEYRKGTFIKSRA